MKQNIKNGLEYVKGRGFDGFVVNRNAPLSDYAKSVIQSGIDSEWVIETLIDIEKIFYIENI